MLLMSLTMKFRGIEPGEEESSYIDRRLRFALGRFSGEITHARVRLSDTNGPRGGVDKHVKIQVTGPRLGHLVIEDCDSDVLTAIDRAADRAGRTVGRHLQRNHLLGRAAEGRREAS